jgi:hypothetical protein
MAVIVYKSPEWKAVLGAKPLSKKCPRCTNYVEFQLVYDTETFAWFIPIRRVYALRCPLCIHWEKASWAIRRDLIKSC